MWVDTCYLCFVALVWPRFAESYRPAVAQVLTRCSTVRLLLLVDPPFIRYDEKSELAQAKRDCIALAEEVQRLRAEVEKERTGRKKAIAAKKQAESDRDDAVARLVAVQSGRPMATVEEAAPPDAAAISARIPEGDTTTGLSKTDSFEKAEAEAGAWGGKHRTNRLRYHALSVIVFCCSCLAVRVCVRSRVGCRAWLQRTDGELGDLSAIQAKEDDVAIATAAAAEQVAKAGSFPANGGDAKPKALVKVAGRRKVRPPPKVPEAATAQTDAGAL